MEHVESDGTETAAWHLRIDVAGVATTRHVLFELDPLPGLTFGGWVEDVAELAEGLGLERFAVIGLSGGGPWAAACAALIPELLAAVGIASSRALAEYNVRERPQAVDEFNEDDREEFELVARPQPRRGGETPHSALRGVDTRAA